ncbi:multicopper oxidase family protein [Streptomyces sp. NPDC088258]|uniref:multicopper oxidase family protein n=1 Tax=Streptomyces sp. NPDC088258 TaxID=3365849 RepID=UPI0038140122
MFETLFLTDAVLALLATAAALAVGRPASGTARRLRRWLYFTAVLVAARLGVACVMLGGGTELADSRLIVQVPLAALPVAWALWKPSGTAARVGAAGVLLSAWWLYVPFGPQDTPYVLIGSVAGLAVVGGLSPALARWRRTGSRVSRLPWLSAVSLLVPAVALVLGGQASAAAGAHHHVAAGEVGVDELTGPRDREPGLRLTLTAARKTIRLASGRSVDALTFNGTSPGPEIRAEKGQLIEVTLVNTDVEEGVTVHWHGVDVPNAEDGVPGVTQNPVRPGERHVYRFVPNRAGTFWYHTHRDALETVERGLFGALIVQDTGEAAFDGVEHTLFTHRWPADGGPAPAFGRDDRPARHTARAGREVLLRLINSSTDPHRVHIDGTRFTVAALDGNAIEGAEPLGPGTDLLLAAGGRYDITFTMPDRPVTLAYTENQGSAALALSPDGAAEPADLTDGTLFDPLTYGSGALAAPDRHDRAYDLRLDDGFGFSRNGFGFASSLINGRLYPAVPALEVTEGERVKVRVANRGIGDHPLHLHGHRLRVLSRNGEPATGSPWWTDTLNIAPGEVFEITFTADNPGIWMDHCHNFEHAANGMIMHLAYTGVSSPYSGNHMPE